MNFGSPNRRTRGSLVNLLPSFREVILLDDEEVPVSREDLYADCMRLRAVGRRAMGLTCYSWHFVSILRVKLRA
jgi:hypothetical protein